MELLICMLLNGGAMIKVEKADLICQSTNGFKLIINVFLSVFAEHGQDTGV